jgi:hypothetical protein
MMSTDETIEERLRTTFHARVAPDRTLSDDKNFFDAGFTSGLLTAVVGDLVATGFTVALVDMFRFPTIRSLANELGRRANPDRSGQSPHSGPGRALPWQSDPARPAGSR